jgi:hypothetical protein
MKGNGDTGDPGTANHDVGALLAHRAQVTQITDKK